LLSLLRATARSIAFNGSQELILEWRKEMEREDDSFSKATALAAMALAPSALDGTNSPEEATDVLKRAYRKQALKLHPDKCPDGPEPFLKMQSAYKVLVALAQGEAEEGGGPRAHRISLLLRTQCLLHRREPDIVGEFTYPAYDTLLTLLHKSLEAGGIGHEHVLPCMELTWLTLNACGDNAPFLGDRGAVPVFSALLARCISEVSADEPAHAHAVTLAALTLRALALVLRAADARAALLDLPAEDRSTFLEHVLRVSQLARATNAAAGAIDVIGSCSANRELQQELVQRGVLAHLVSRMLLCAPPACR
jgi:hypothetical protein